jgi:peroxiredoxin
MSRARLLLFGVLLAIAAVAALVSSRIATAPLDLEPPQPPPREDLIGRTVPAFSGTTIDGDEVSNKSLVGRPAVINVWATWCRPCVEELPRVEQEIWRKHGDKITVLAVARGESSEVVRKFNEQARFTFSLLPDPSRTITRLFGGDDSIPRTYVVGRSGSIVYQSFGYTPSNFGRLVDAVDREVKR